MGFQEAFDFLHKYLPEEIEQNAGNK